MIIYKILSTRIADAVVFVKTELDIDGDVHTAEIAVSTPSGEQDITTAISNYASNYKWRKDATANIPNIIAALPLNQEITIE
jgi:hypothetical protein